MSATAPPGAVDRAAGAVPVSVVLCTWNRASMLEGALEALLSQEEAPPHEILVVDNASTDGTAAVVGQACRRHSRLRYLSEPRPGLSHARNTGVREAAGEAVAFTDDDVRVSPRWIHDIALSLGRYRDAACIGGPVLPAWTAAAPAWLTEEQWPALGTQNYGPEPFRVDAQRPVCLIGANLVIRRSALDAVGPFDVAVQRVGDGIGSTEDHEYHIRLWAAGLFGIYDPSLAVRAVIPTERLAKRYHRRWHFGHGRHIARMRLPEMERADCRLFDVPGHIARQAASETVEVARSLLRGDLSRAFARELRLWFAAGFIRERLQ